MWGDRGDVTGVTGVTGVTLYIEQLRLIVDWVTELWVTRVTGVTVCFYCNSAGHNNSSWPLNPDNAP